MPSENLIMAVAATAELCGRTFTPAAAAVFVDDLSGYPEPQVLGALRRCRREVRGILTVNDVVSRLDDGRPGADEAWAMIPQDESGSVVWSHEMALAFGVAQPLLAVGDRVAARMAFKEAYNCIVAMARDAGTPVKWTPSFGLDPGARDAAVMTAARAGRMTIEHAVELCPAIAHEAPSLVEGLQRIAGLLADTTKKVTA